MAPTKKSSEAPRTQAHMVCRICLRSHPLRRCEKFLQVDYSERMQLVSIYKYCAGCLSHDHTWRTCESTGKCKRCGDLHHTLLHKPGSRLRSSSQKKSKDNKKIKIKRCNRGQSLSTRPKGRGPNLSQSSPGDTVLSSDMGCERPVLSRAVVPSQLGNFNRRAQSRKDSHRTHDIVALPNYHINQAIFLKPTAVVKMVSKDRYIFERALIDASAECSIVTEEVVRRLGARTVRVGRSERCLLTIRGNHGSSETVETYAEVRRRYNLVTPSKSVDGRILDEFPGLQLADPQFYVAAPVNLVLGADVYSKIIRNGVAGGTFGKPLAQFTIFGYIISGSCAS